MRSTDYVIISLIFTYFSSRANKKKWTRRVTHKLLLEMKILCRHINVHYFNFSFPQSYFFFIKNFFFISRKCNCLKQNVQSLILKWKIYTAVINYRVDELRHEELLIGDLMRNCRPTHTSWIIAIKMRSPLVSNYAAACNDVNEWASESNLKLILCLFPSGQMNIRWFIKWKLYFCKDGLKGKARLIIDFLRL